MEPPPPVTSSPFRLGLTYTRVLAEDGDLVNDSLSTNAIGIDLVSPSYSYARDHLGLAYQFLQRFQEGPPARPGRRRQAACLMAAAEQVPDSQS